MPSADVNSLENRSVGPMEGRKYIRVSYFALLSLFYHDRAQKSNFICLCSASAEPERKRRRKSRWGAEETDKTFIPGMPTVLPTNLSKEQEEAYVCEYYILDLSTFLKILILPLHT